jgi:5-methylcytosine-specific restriction endonuclease McrA
MPETIVCGVCGTIFHSSPSHRRKYCSRACGDIGRTKPIEELRANYRMKVLPPDHPLRVNAVAVPEHRVILWNRYGPGTHSCHRCGKSVTWFGRPASELIVTDHLDQNSKNNDPENLAISCQRCNTMNTKRNVQDDELFIVRKDGTRLRAIQVDCAFCGAAVLIPKCYDPTTRRYCDRRCFYAGRAR